MSSPQRWLVTTGSSSTYESYGEVGERLLNRLPSSLVVQREEWDPQLLDLLAAEVTGDTPGQDTVLDRLLDLVLVTVLRVWFSQPDSEAPPWYRAQNDPVVGRALRLIHNHPDRPWTVASLASEIGVSRATLARRFAETVGEPPMTYLTDWRMDLAADLLTQPDMTIGAVAQRIGYSTPYALSTAFKRVRGISPRDHRTAALTSG